MTELDRAAVDRWTAAWRGRAGSGNEPADSHAPLRPSAAPSSALLDRNHRRWAAVVDGGGVDLGPEPHDPVESLLDRALTAVAGGAVQARGADGATGVGGLHLATGLLAAAAQLRADAPVLADVLWQTGLQAADLAASGADLGAVLATTAAVSRDHPDPVVAALADALAALRSALSVPDRLEMLPCGAGPGLNPGDPVLLEITCAVDRTEFHACGVADLLDHDARVCELQYWSAGERIWLHLHTRAAGPVLQELLQRLHPQELAVTAPRGR